MREDTDLTQHEDGGHRIDWVASIPFLAVHAVAVAAPFIAPISWKWGALALASYLLRIFGITAGYHRYFSHRTYRTGRVFQFLLALLGTTSTQKGPLWWAAHHRDHHKYSDTEDDIHSPKQSGFWWSHVGWILSTRYNRTKLERVKDLAGYPELRWLDRWHHVPVIGYAAAMYLAFGLPGILWGYFVSQVFVWHGTFLVNSLAHVIGRRHYETSDTSRNSALIAFLVLGEGWHNNHHHYQSTANQGWFWWEIDVTWYVLRALGAIGVVSDLRTPPAAIRDRTARAMPAKESAPEEETAPVEESASAEAA